MTIKVCACTVCSFRSVHVNYVFLGPRYSLGLLQPKRPKLAEGRKKPPLKGDPTLNFYTAVWALQWLLSHQPHHQHQSFVIAFVILVVIAFFFVIVIRVVAA